MTATIHIPLTQGHVAIIDALADKGFLTAAPKVARSIVLTPAGWAASGSVEVHVLDDGKGVQFQFKRLRKNGQSAKKRSK